jgi:ribonuclease T1
MSQRRPASASRNARLSVKRIVSLQRKRAEDGRHAITSLGAFLVSMLMLLAAGIEAPAARPAHAVVLAGTAAVPDVDVPQKARDVLAEIERRHGEPPPGYVGGRTFQNRERHLPRGSYREYDVNPKASGRARGAERIVIERKTGKAYYTRDHYETFVPMN